MSTYLSDPPRYIKLSRVPAVIERIDGERPSMATIYRWVQRGLRGQRLRVLYVGGYRRTTVEWVHDFFEAVTEAAEAEQCPVATVGRTNRGQAIANAERELEAAGI